MKAFFNFEIKEVLKDDLKKIYPGVVVFNDDMAFIDNENDPENRGYNIFDKDRINEYYRIYEIIKHLILGIDG